MMSDLAERQRLAVRLPSNKATKVRIFDLAEPRICCGQQLVRRSFPRTKSSCTLPQHKMRLRGNQIKNFWKIWGKLQVHGERVNHVQSCLHSLTRLLLSGQERRQCRALQLVASRVGFFSRDPLLMKLPGNHLAHWAFALSSRRDRLQVAVRGSMPVAEIACAHTLHRAGG